MGSKEKTIHWWMATEETFCGRHEVLRRIWNGLDRSDSFAVLGHRGMGKSMVLKKLIAQRTHRGSFDPVCLRIQCSGREENAFTLVKNIRDKFSSALACLIKIDEEEIKSIIGYRITPTKDKPIIRMIENAEALTGEPVSIELFFDDVHRLRNMEWIGDFLANMEFELFSNRMHASKLRCVFFGDIRMKKLLVNLPFSDIWQRLCDVWLQPLSEEEVIELLNNIELPESYGDPTQLASLIVSWSGAHPSLTQYLLRDLLESHDRDPVETIESSASRFIAELSKMLESSWNDLDTYAQALIHHVSASGSSISVQQLAAKLSIPLHQFQRALKEAFSSGFIRCDGDNTFPPGKVMTLWLNWHPSQNKGQGSSGIIGYHIVKSCHFLPTIMHLSDLHFSGGGHAWDDSLEIPGLDRPVQDRPTLMGTLLEDLRTLRGRDAVLWPDAVIASGDLLFQCQKEGIKQAVDFLGSLSAEIGIERSRVVICPGNHEQNRIVFNEEPKAQLGSYCQIWNEFYPSEIRRLPLEWTPGEYTHVYRLKNLEILTLNSCEDLDPEPSGNNGPKEQGYIGIKQLAAAADLLREEKPPAGYLRVAVLHHHLSQHQWASNIDYSILREVGRVLSWLRRFNFDLVFHGHQHCVGLQTQVIDKRYLTIIAGGSAGVASKYRWRGGMPLTYQIVCNSEENKALRICRSFDLHAEAWIDSQHYKPLQFPIGDLV